jgi:hypothetical protein
MKVLIQFLLMVGHHVVIARLRRQVGDLTAELARLKVRADGVHSPKEGSESGQTESLGPILIGGHSMSHSMSHSVNEEVSGHPVESEDEGSQRGARSQSRTLSAEAEVKVEFEEEEQAAEGLRELRSQSRTLSAEAEVKVPK